MKDEYRDWLQEQRIINDWSDVTLKNYGSIINTIDVSNSKSLLSSMARIRKNTKDATYNQKINVLKSFMIFLEERHPDNSMIPTLKKLKRIKNPNSESHAPYTDEQVNKLLSTAIGWKHQFFFLALNCGLRKNEIRNLNVEDIDLTTGEITVWKGKNNKKRVVIISDIKPLKKWDKYRKLNQRKIKGNQWLFTRYGSRPNLQSGSVFKSLEEKLGFKLKAHSGRSTYATKEYEITSDVKLVQEQLGHSSSATTDKYIQRSLKQRSKLINGRGNLYT